VALVLTFLLLNDFASVAIQHIPYIRGTYNLNSRVRCVATRNTASYIQYLAATHPTDYYN